VNALSTARTPVPPHSHPRADLASARAEPDRARRLRRVPGVPDRPLPGQGVVDNILAFQFANGLFEPAWNRNHIAYVQIDVPETLSIGGRGGLYDQTGPYRDMIVTHLFQVLGFVAMEPPTSFAVRHLRDETAKVFDALKPIDVRLCNDQVGGRLVQASLHNVSHCTPGASWGDSLRLALVGRLTVPSVPGQRIHCHSA
jgi:hypothetical protein